MSLIELPGGLVVKNPSANAEDEIGSLGWEDILEKEMVTHSGILAWEISWTEQPVGWSPWDSKRVGHDLATKQQQQQHIFEAKTEQRQ